MHRNCVGLVLHYLSGCYVYQQVFVQVIRLQLYLVELQDRVKNKRDELLYLAQPFFAQVADIYVSSTYLTLQVSGKYNGEQNVKLLNNFGQRVLSLRQVVSYHQDFVIEAVA